MLTGDVAKARGSELLLHWRVSCVSPSPPIVAGLHQRHGAGDGLLVLDGLPRRGAQA